MSDTEAAHFLESLQMLDDPAAAATAHPTSGQATQSAGQTPGQTPGAPSENPVQPSFDRTRTVGRDDYRLGKPGAAVVVKIAKPRAALLEAARQTLTADGFTIAYIDPAQGKLITAPLVMRLNSHQADCGKMWGMSYLIDGRARTRVIYWLAAEDGALSIRASVDGIQDEGFNSYQQLDCASIGVLEADLAHKLGG
jgi:hypothetical protein